MTEQLDVATALAEAVTHVTAPQDLDATLDTIVRVACDSTDAIDHVGITLAHSDGRVETRAASDDVVRRLDRAQIEVGEGPALFVLDGDPVVRVDHADREERWPGFMPHALECGVRSFLGIRLLVDNRSHGVLTIYSRSTDTVSPETEKLATLFAVHAELVLGHVQRIEDLMAAMASRQMIGLALGILMHRLQIDESTAFSYLTRLAATQQTKVRDVAASLVDEHLQRLGSP